jgi:hypothetical protein
MSMKTAWECCVICGKETLPYLRVLRVAGRRLEAVHKGRCYERYLEQGAETTPVRECS